MIVANVFAFFFPRRLQRAFFSRTKLPDDEVSET
jgi:hypothetical protein